MIVTNEFITTPRNSVDALTVTEWSDGVTTVSIVPEIPGLECEVCGSKHFIPRIIGDEILCSECNPTWTEI